LGFTSISNPQTEKEKTIAAELLTSLSSQSIAIQEINPKLSKQLEYTIAANKAYHPLAKFPQQVLDINKDFLYIFNEFRQTERQSTDSYNLMLEINSLEEQYLNLVEPLWQNAPIEGTIFANNTKKKAALDQLKEMLFIPIVDEKYVNEYLIGEELSLISMNVFERIILAEQTILNFVAQELELKPSISADLLVNISEPTIILGEPLQATISIGDITPSDIEYTATVATSEINTYIDTYNYTAKAKRAGKKNYLSKVAIENKLTGSITTFTKKASYTVLPN
jgi:hypothetical protein